MVFLDFGLALARTDIWLRPPHVEDDHGTIPFHGDSANNLKWAHL